MTQPPNKIQSDPRRTRLLHKLEIELREGRITAWEGAALACAYDALKDRPDGRFGELLIALIQGED